MNLNTSSYVVPSRANISLATQAEEIETSNKFDITVNINSAVCYGYNCDI